MAITKEFLHFPPDATIGEVLSAYRRRKAQWWWFLTTSVDDEYFVCTFSSLLPYLTGRTDHIVHRPGARPSDHRESAPPLAWRSVARRPVPSSRAQAR